MSALKVMATGGIYLAGGIPLHMLRVFEGPRFMESFKRKGRFAELMEQYSGSRHSHSRCVGRSCGLRTGEL